MDTNATAVMDPAKAGTKPDDKPAKGKTKGSKPKADKAKPRPSTDAIKKAMETLEAAGMMSSEEQMEAVVAYKLQGIYNNILPIISQLHDDDGTPLAPTEEFPGIAIFPDGSFDFIDDDDDDEDDEQPKAKKGKKGKKAKKGDHNPDWKTEAATIQKALIAYEKGDDDVTAKTIHDKMGQRGATAPAITTIYNWIKGKSLPNQKYHRKLRSILGLNVG